MSAGVCRRWGGGDRGVPTERPCFADDVRTLVSFRGTRRLTSSIYTRTRICLAMAADVFAILADPTRRRIVELLHEGERSMSDVAAGVDIHQPGVSRHLRILHEAGFVSVRAERQRRLYSLRPEPFEQLESWMRRYAFDEMARLRRLAEVVEERRKKRTRK